MKLRDAIMFGIAINQSGSIPLEVVRADGLGLNHPRTYTVNRLDGGSKTRAVFHGADLTSVERYLETETNLDADAWIGMSY